MPLFAKTLHEQISDLNAKVVALEQQLADKDAEVESLKEQAAMDDTTIAGITERQHELIRNHEDAMRIKQHLFQVEEARLEALAEANRRDAEKYRAIVMPWIWHPAQTVEIEGKRISVMEARTDLALANFRLPKPEGMEL